MAKITIKKTHSRMVLFEKTEPKTFRNFIIFMINNFTVHSKGVNVKFFTVFQSKGEENLYVFKYKNHNIVVYNKVLDKFLIDVPKIWLFFKGEFQHCDRDNYYLNTIRSNEFREAYLEIMIVLVYHLKCSNCFPFLNIKLSHKFICVPNPLRVAKIDLATFFERGHAGFNDSIV